MDVTTGVLVEAMRKGYCDKLQVLKVVGYYDELEHFQVLCDALADGLCTKINALEVPGINDMVSSMGKALQSRMSKGCRGLISLKVKNGTHSLSPLLSSGACESLEELEIGQMGHEEKEDLSEWLLRTRAPRLQALVSSGMDSDVAQSLCSPGIAPRLQVLELYSVDAASLPFLSQAVGGGAWPYLRQLKIKGTRAMPSLVEAIGVGARELTTLKLGFKGGGREGCMAVARMLRDGGCPRLEELDLSHSRMGDGALMEVARALEGGALCNTTLRRLNLGICSITSVDMRELMESMGRGAFPHLECLDMSDNWHISDDGVVALAGVLSGGSLRFLQELDLSSVDMGPEGANALFQAFRDHKPCPHLKKLDLGYNKIGDGAVVHLASAVEAGALQHLQELYLYSVDMGEEGFKSLVKAIVVQHPNPSCPRLQEIGVSGNKEIGDNGVVHLAEMMMVAGAMQHLRQMHIYGVGMTVKGAGALLQSLRESHVCPALETVIGFHDKDLRILDQVRDEMNASRGRARQVKIKIVVP